MIETSGLTVRQHERQEVAFPIELDIVPEHRAQVTFSASSGVSRPHIVEGETVDVSSGGAGLSVRRFVPRGTRALLSILDPVAVSARDDGSPIRTALFRNEVRVRRVSLSGHEPTYFLGVSFVGDMDDFDSRIANLIARLAESREPAGGGR